MKVVQGSECEAGSIDEKVQRKLLKAKAMGVTEFIHNNGVYAVEENGIILTKVTEGTEEFEIPEFCTGFKIERKLGNATSKAFYDCKKIKLRNKSSITNFDDLFAGCVEIEYIDLSEFDTSKVVSMREMFVYCISLSEIDVSGFDTTNVQDMSNMFSNCWELQEIIFGNNFTTRNTNNLWGMFKNCAKLRTVVGLKLDLGVAGISNHMFLNCHSLEEIDLSATRFAKDVNAHSMFYGCNMLKRVDLSNLGNGPYDARFQNMFYGCNALEEIILPKEMGSELQTIFGIFSDCRIIIKG